jgi:hypothetical protein
VLDPKVHLITFGGGNFAYRRSARRVALQAEASGIFESITKVTDKSFRRYCSSAWDKHQEFMLNSKKGFGYWLWKPTIIAKRLGEIPPNDVLLYLDAGCELNLVDKEPRARISWYFNLARQHGSLAMQLTDLPEKGIFPTESRYSKASLIQWINPSNETLSENQLMATAMWFAHTDVNKEFLIRWEEVAVSQNYSLLTDDLLQDENDDFIGHRHDQSIFSLLYKESRMFFIPDETNWKPNWKEKGSFYPIWAMRNRTGVSRGVMRVPDLIDRVVLRVEVFINALRLKVMPE